MFYDNIVHIYLSTTTNPTKLVHPFRSSCFYIQQLDAISEEHLIVLIEVPLSIEPTIRNYLTQSTPHSNNQGAMLRLARKIISKKMNTYLEHCGGETLGINIQYVISSLICKHSPSTVRIQMN